MQYHYNPTIKMSIMKKKKKWQVLKVSDIAHESLNCYNQFGKLFVPLRSSNSISRQIQQNARVFTKRNTLEYL